MVAVGLAGSVARAQDTAKAPGGATSAPASGAAANAPAPVDHGDAHDGQRLEGFGGPEAVERRLRWWTEARFGMFIHWGLYAQDGCHWQGQDGKTEHMMRHLQIPLKEYAKIAQEWKPKAFDARQWVRLAKEAGMKYMVITAKHHDGFAMYGSKASGYNVVERTPWKRDPIKELAEASRRAGLKFGVYYSLGRDWEDPDVPTRDGWRSNTWDFPDESKKDFSRYFERKVKPQVRELLTKYAPIAVMWFDTPEKISKAQSEELLAMIHQISPKTIVNARVGNKMGDYAVKEQQIPTGGQPQPWETCMTMNGHWGYHKKDDNWKPTRALVRTLADVASKGGNFLLNVGPMGDGSFPLPSIDRLLAVGRWMKVNGESITGSTACQLKGLTWGRCTQVSSSRGQFVYLHVFDWPTDGQLMVMGLHRKVVAATMMKGRKNLPIRVLADNVAISVPMSPPDPDLTTIRLKLAPLEEN